MAERMLVCEIGAFCRARVVSFELLGREIFAYAGGNVIPEVTPLGRQMVIGHLLRRLKPQLGYFAGSARQPGLATELDAAQLMVRRAANASSMQARSRTYRSSTSARVVINGRSPVANRIVWPSVATMSPRDRR